MKKGHLLTHCKRGHEFTDENTVVKRDGRRRCKTCAYLRARKYYYKNPEIHRQRRKSYYKENSEIEREKRRAHYASNSEITKQKRREYYERNKEKERLACKNYRRNNPEKYKASDKASQLKRRVKIRSSPFPVNEWKILLELFDGWCPYCGTENNKLTVDHLKPVSRGGTNDIWNLLPVCKPCNSRKKDKTLTEYVEQIKATIGGLSYSCSSQLRT